MRAGLRQGSGSWLCGAALLASASLAFAQAKPAAKAAPTSLSGTWRAGATSMDVAIQSWGTDCGPRPESSRSSGGGVVSVTQADKQLTVRSRDMEVRSDACWSRNPSMRRTSSSMVDNVWTTQCRTAQNDPREEQGTYVLKVLGPDTLLYQDVSRYNWALNSSKCVATFTTTQTLARVSGAQAVAPNVVLQPSAATKPAATAAEVKPVVAAEPEVKERACTPGKAVRLSLRPKRAEIEVGQRVCFRPRLTDANDCAIPSPAVEWSLSHAKSVRAELSNGCFTAASTTAEAEGDFKILASSQGLRAEGSVTVRSVDLSALIAKRIEGGALNGFAEVAPVIPPPKAASRVATRTVTERPRSQTPLWASIGAAVLALGLLSAWFLRRKPTPIPASSLPPRPEVTADDEPSPGSARPAYKAPSLAPATELLGKAPISHRPASEQWICPLCRLGYPAHQETCPRDGSALMPYSEFSKRSQESSRDKQKRCPKCGTQYPSSAAFCAEDGASLVDSGFPPKD